jgi:putative membrane protein (TIGR04086 family)
VVVLKTTIVNVRTFAGFDVNMILRSVGIAYIATISILALLSALLVFTNLSEAFISFGLILTAVISNIIAGTLISKKTRTRGWINGALGGAVYVILLYFIGAIFFDSATIGKGTLLMLATCLISGTIGGIIGVNMKHRR